MFFKGIFESFAWISFKFQIVSLKSLELFVPILAYIGEFHVGNTRAFGGLSNGHGPL